MAHPDGAELCAGGTLALHAHAAAVTVAVPRHEPARMAEAEAGAAILGARLQVLPNPVSSAAVHELITGSRPEVVITHPLADVHPDHRHVPATVLAALPEAVISTGYPQRVYTTDTYNSLTLDGPLHAGVIVDITATFEVKAKALAAHGGTQPISGHFGPMAETLARLWGARIGARYAEAFTRSPCSAACPPPPACKRPGLTTRRGTTPARREPAMPVPAPVYQSSTLTAAEQATPASDVISAGSADAPGTCHLAELGRAVAGRIGVPLMPGRSDP